MKFTFMAVLSLIFISAPHTCAQENAAPVVITKGQALEDLDQLKEILERYSSYLHLKGFNYACELDQLKAGLTDEVNIAEFTLQLEKFIGGIGDRHARVKPKGDRLKVEKFLPFVVAPFEKKVLALKPDDKKPDQYVFYLKKFPYLKAIDGMPIEEFLQKTTWRHAHAPTASKLYYGLAELRYLGVQFYKLNKPLPEKINFTFTNGEKDKVIALAPLQERLPSWKDLSGWEIKQDSSKLLKPNIGYFKVSSMFSPRRNPDFFEQLSETMRQFEDTEALIIDIRNNGGGSRDVLNAFAPYFSSPDSKPWVANLAKVRCDQNFNEDMESMTGRYLFSYGSDKLSDADRTSIDEYMNGHNTEWQYDLSNYTAPFFMLFSHDRGKNHYYYDKPVYILVNELCFSAASVFTTALNGMGNIQITGVNTDGSSGRSNYFDLNHSKINLKLSTMISFQRNGQTLDTNGTKPDIYIPRDLDQVLRKRDSQLEKLVELISKTHEN